MKNNSFNPFLSPFIEDGIGRIVLIIVIKVSYECKSTIQKGNAVWGAWELSLLYLQFFSKTVLKNKVNV